jgi:hypothetical protein
MESLPPKFSLVAWTLSRPHRAEGMLSVSPRARSCRHEGAGRHRWIAIGDPAQIVPPQEHDRIWSAEGPATFPLTVFGLERAPTARESIMPELTRRYARALGEHKTDQPVEVG